MAGDQGDVGGLEFINYASRQGSGLPNPMKDKINFSIFLSYALLVAYLSLRSADGSINEPWDKVGHFVLYAVFSMLGYRLQNDPRKYLYICVAIVAYGGLMEIGQSLMPDRTMSGYDFLANAIGVTIGAVVARLIWSSESLDSRRCSR
jgi:VanZ family protein